MNKNIEIDGENYIVNTNEFNTKYIEKYCNLKMHEDLGLLERIVGLINDISMELNINNSLFITPTHGGFKPIKCSKKIKINFVYFTNDDNNKLHENNLRINLNENNINNVKLINNINDFSNIKEYFIIYNDNSFYNNYCDYSGWLNQDYCIIISLNNDYLNDIYEHKYNITDTNLKIYIPNTIFLRFFDKFKYYLINLDNETILNYDNLINLCIMVKNGGEQFKQMLIDNLDIIDRWTILDTGSSDNTINYINEVLSQKKGELYQEPFINFRDSRNRLLDLAGKTCKYTLMLDDTYIVKGNLRKFLIETRSDQFSDSFSIFLRSFDSEYGSNRILKSHSNIRYLYKIHEVIDPDNNNNVIIPNNDSYIEDRSFDYMQERTMERKKLDFKLLQEELEDNPNNPRTYYYIGQTFSVIKDYKNAFEWLSKRVEHPNVGFIQEKVDAAFEKARIGQYQLNIPWKDCEKYYLYAFELDKSRPEALYFIGAHYYLQNDYDKCFPYFKKAFEIGYPIHCQYGLKPTLSFYFLPKFLSNICYLQNDYKLGFEASKLYLEHNKEDNTERRLITSWNNIYTNLLMIDNSQKVIINEKPIFCFIAPGGFNKWSGSTINNTGVGGSETFIIEMARYIQYNGVFNVYVFCSCDKEETFEGVIYKPLQTFANFINQTYIHSCMISRYFHYIPAVCLGNVENVYFIMHDMFSDDMIIPYNKKIKNMFCLTEFHSELFVKYFPMFKNITETLYYGIDMKKFNINYNNSNFDKISNKFIYSSFANRGLLPLLKMWPSIYNYDSSATLHIYCDIDNQWVNDVAPDKIKEIKDLFNLYNKFPNNLNIYYHGWCSKEELANAWKSADYWLYPCTFVETFCLTALEAAVSKTLPITNNLGALKYTVGDRGVIIDGDPNSIEWVEKAIDKIKYIMSPENKKYKQYLIDKNYEWGNQLSWESQANKFLNNYIFNTNSSIEDLSYKSIINYDKISIDLINNISIEFNKKSLQKCNVLDLYSNNGYAIVNILCKIRNSFADVIDDYNSDNTAIFKSLQYNINDLYLQDNIQIISGNVIENVMNIYKKDKMYDIIRISDTCNNYYDIYSILIILWDILNNNGVLIIEYFSFGNENLTNFINIFFNNRTDKYILLNNDKFFVIKKI